MPRRIRLRSRIFAITGLYAAMLFGIAFLLTWRAGETQRQSDRLIDVDLRAVARLEELLANQQAFDRRWRQGDDPRRYAVVTQLLEVAPLTTLPLDRLRDAVFDYEDALAQPDPAIRRRLNGAVRDEARKAIDERKRSIERTLPSLRRSARDMMAIALGVAYIIIIVSFAVATLTLARVVRPLEALARASERLAGGDLEARAPVAGDREVASLGAAFNRMAEEVARSRRELEERARTDELTTLPNFRAFSEVLDQEMKRAGRYGESFGILVLDLDHFKQYNDRYGHLAGNEALQNVAESLRNSVREADTAARYGGEEFAVILPNMPPAEMHAAAERIRTAIERLPAAPGRSPVTVSIGGASFPSDGVAAERLFAVADTRLYEAKKAGRNCVVMPGRAPGAGSSGTLRNTRELSS